MGYINVPNNTAHTPTCSWFAQPDQVTSIHLCHYILFLISVPISHRTEKPYQPTIMKNMHFHSAKKICIYRKTFNPFGVGGSTAWKWSGNLVVSSFQIHSFSFQNIQLGLFVSPLQRFVHFGRLYGIYDCLTNLFLKKQK